MLCLSLCQGWGCVASIESTEAMGPGNSCLSPLCLVEAITRFFLRYHSKRHMKIKSLNLGQPRNLEKAKIDEGCDGCVEQCLFLFTFKICATRKFKLTCASHLGQHCVSFGQRSLESDQLRFKYCFCHFLVNLVKT